MEHSKIIEALKEYKELLDTGVITQEDFDKKKQELLDSSSAEINKPVADEPKDEATPAQKEKSDIDIKKITGQILKIIKSKVFIIGFATAAIIIIAVAVFVLTRPSENEKTMEVGYLSVIQEYIDNKYYDSAIKTCDEYLALYKSSDIKKLRNQAEKLKENNTDDTKADKNTSEKVKSEGNETIAEEKETEMTEDTVKKQYEEFDKLYQQWIHNALNSENGVYDPDVEPVFDEGSDMSIYQIKDTSIKSVDEIYAKFKPYCTEELYNKLLSDEGFEYKDYNGTPCIFVMGTEGCLIEIDDYYVEKVDDNEYKVFIDQKIEDFDSIGTRTNVLHYTKSSNGTWQFSKIDYGSFFYIDADTEYNDGADYEYDDTYSDYGAY